MSDRPRPQEPTEPSKDDTPEFSAPLPAPNLAFAATTHKGRVREVNEDQYLIVHARKLLEILDTSLEVREFADLPEQEGFVFLVADGIGGRAGGERASAIAVKDAALYIKMVAKWFFLLDDPDEDVRLRMLRETLERTDRHIIKEGNADPALAGMGTTLTAAVIIGADVFIVHVGDSRAYVLHEGQLTQATVDHTLAQELFEQGLIEPGDAKTHKMRKVLTNALGARLGVRPDFVKLRLSPGDRLLLCTDGLSELVSDARIAELLKLCPEPRQACQTLVDAALAAGGTDNVTVIVVAAG